MGPSSKDSALRKWLGNPVIGAPDLAILHMQHPFVLVRRLGISAYLQLGSSPTSSCTLLRVPLPMLSVDLDA